MERVDVIFWDFDGVIMDSMPIRDKGFQMVLEEFAEDQVEQLLEFHKQNGGLSRYVKFRYFFEEIRNKPITEEEVNLWAHRFSEIMLTNLKSKELLIKDSLDFIEKNSGNYRMHIVSGSDSHELNEICKAVGIDQYFVSIEGSPTPKNTLVKDRLAAHNYDPDYCVLIGDSINDKIAAEVNGLRFYGYNYTGDIDRMNVVKSFQEFRF